MIGCTGDHGAPEQSITRKPESKVPADPWVVTCSNPQDQTPSLLWNGLVGFRFGRDMSATSQQFFSIDEYEAAGEEKIIPMSNPLPNGFLIDGKRLPITSDYSQQLDLKSSLLTTRWKSGDLTIKSIVTIDPATSIIGERWSIEGTQQNQQVDFDMGKPGKLGSHATDTRQIVLDRATLSERFTVQSSKTGSRTIDFMASFEPTVSLYQADQIQATTPLPTFDELVQKTKKIWEDRWKTDILIDGPIEDQQAIHSMLYYLRSAVHPSKPRSVSPFGLSNAMYFGHVFWDADIWDFPVYALIDPPIAKTIASYRVNTLSQAMKNADGKGAKYAWESSVTGKETVPGPSKLELHISGDVAWMLHQAAGLGLVSMYDAETARKAVGTFFRSVAKPVPGKTEFTIPNVMSPDETHTGDNDLYTNLLAQWTHDGNWTGKPVYSLPKDSKSFITYDGDNFRSYKQAAAVLSIYPLQFPPAIAEARTMMDRFSDKTLKNGPAMSDSVHATIWARLGERDKAYDAWKRSWEPFTQQPLMLFSEKRTKANTYFITGAGGSLQTLLFGFLGFRLDSVQEPDSALIQQLQGDTKLSIKANFPKQWKSVKLMNFNVLGKRYTLTATHQANGPDAVQVSQGD